MQRVWLLLGVGCSFPTGTATTDAGRADAVVTIDGCTSYSTLFNTCQLGAGGVVSLVATDYAYDTALHVLCVADSSGNCQGPAQAPPHVVVANVDVWVVRGFALPGGVTLHVRGPLAFA